MKTTYQIPRMSDGRAEAYAWPGGYPLFYVTQDCACLCPACCDSDRELIEAAAADNDAQWNVVAADVNWEDTALYCDHCNKRIESAYGDDEESAD